VNTDVSEENCASIFRVFVGREIVWVIWASCWKGDHFEHWKRSSILKFRRKTVPPSSGSKSVGRGIVWLYRQVAGKVIILNHCQGRWIPTFRRNIVPPSSESKFVGRGIVWLYRQTVGKKGGYRIFRGKWCLHLQGRSV
jgi:hypothetical protein